jgi:HD-like signal output (HDOD) protein
MPTTPPPSPPPSPGLTDVSGKSLSPDQFREKLHKALQRDGDFPASAKVVGELRALASDPRTTANQLTEIILQEPTLGARVLHLVNSSFYRRGKPVMTVSQAVIQIGMKALIDLCAGLILLQKFVSSGRRGGPFATCLQQTVITSLISSSLAKSTSTNTNTPKKSAEESGYLVGSLAEIGPLLVAYYFPQVYEKAVKRSETKRQHFAQSLQEIIGLSRIELSLEVVAALELPDFFRKVLLAAESPQFVPTNSGLSADEAAVRRVGNALFAARAISESIVSSRGADDLEQTMSRVTRTVGLDPQTTALLIGELPATFSRHCAALEVTLPNLPAFVGVMSQAPAPTPEGVPAPLAEEDRFSQFADEIREAIERREPPASIITTVMETLAWGLGFHRVILLLLSPDRKGLVGRMAIGDVPHFDPKTLQRAFDAGLAQRSPDAVAFKKGRPVFHGESILPDGWPLAAIPVGFETRCIGVIYGDRIGTDAELTAREQASIGMLAELLDRALAGR